MLSPATARALAQLLGFRHVVRHLYADNRDPVQVRQRLAGALALWPELLAELQAFEHWLAQLIALAEGTADSSAADTSAAGKPANGG